MINNFNNIPHNLLEIRSPYAPRWEHLISLETINDLEDTLMNPVLRTQQDAISSIRAHSRIILSVSSDGDFCVSPAPRPHMTAEDARTECRRLAKLTPGKMFVFVTLEGAELVPANNLSI